MTNLISHLRENYMNRVGISPNRMSEERDFI